MNSSVAANRPLVGVAHIDRGSAPNWFVSSAATVLGLTGFAKVWNTFGSVKLLAVEDPIAGIPFRWLLLTVGVLELVIAGVCFFSRNRRLAALLVAWLATSFLMYRIGLIWIGWQHPCACIGNLASVLRLSDQAADNIMKLLLAYLHLGSYGLLLWQWRQGRQARLPGTREIMQLSSAWSAVAASWAANPTAKSSEAASIVGMGVSYTSRGHRLSIFELLEIQG